MRRLIFVTLTLFTVKAFAGCAESVSSLKKLENHIDNQKHSCTDDERTAYGDLCDMSYKDLKEYYKSKLGEVLIWEGIAKIKNDTTQEYEAFSKLAPNQVADIKDKYNEVVNAVSFARFARSIFEDPKGREFLNQNKGISEYCKNSELLESELCLAYKKSKTSHDSEINILVNDLIKLRKDGNINTTNESKFKEYANELHFGNLTPKQLEEQLKEYNLSADLEGGKLSKQRYKGFFDKFNDNLKRSLFIKDDKGHIKQLKVTNKQYSDLNTLVNKFTVLSGDDAVVENQKKTRETYKAKLKQLYNQRSLIYKDRFKNLVDEINAEMGDVCSYSMLAGDCLYAVKSKPESDKRDDIIDHLQGFNTNYESLSKDVELPDLACFDVLDDALENCDIPVDEAMENRTEAYRLAKRAEKLIKKLQANDQIKAKEDVKSLIVYNLQQSSCLGKSKNMVVTAKCGNENSLTSTELALTLDSTGEIISHLNASLNENDIKTKEANTIKSCQSLSEILNDDKFVLACIKPGVTDPEDKKEKINTFDHVNSKRNHENEIRRQYRSRMHAYALGGTAFGTWMNIEQQQLQTDSLILNAQQQHFYSSPEYQEMIMQQRWAQRFMMPQTGVYGQWGLSNLQHMNYFNYQNSLVNPVSNSLNNDLTYNPVPFVNPIPTSSTYGN